MNGRHTLELSTPNHSHQPFRSSNSWPSPWPRIIHTLTWTPPRCRRRSTTTTTPTSQPFSLPMNLLLGLAATITAANLYYTYPILNKVASSFSVTYERASLIPTLMQAGYGSGILLLCPLGDGSRIRIRPFVLALIATTALFWLALCTLHDFRAFCAFSYLAGFKTVTPQLLIPLAGSLAPPARRATAISVVFAGLMLGMLLPRVLSGLVARYVDWRYTYWAALGPQGLILILLWSFLPDYPCTRPGDDGELTYLRMLASILDLVIRQPIVAYACVMVFFSNAVFASYWTTLTAILSSPLYDYSSLKIGLFALIGIAPLLCVPTYSRVVIDRFVPHLSVVLGLVYAIIGVVVGTCTGRFTVAGLVVQAIAVDFGVQTASIAYRAAIFAAAPDARNRTNVAYTVSAFVGQLMGTSVGNHLYATGGWVRSGAANVGFLAMALCVTLLRGPRETNWFGWRGGLGLRIVDGES